MDDHPDLLKKLCCTCLSKDRKLKQLCRLADGINNLYFLLSFDSEAYREGFYKDTAHWFICWECWAVISRLTRFRSQVCKAQRQLADILDGRTNLEQFNHCLSQLSYSDKTTYEESVHIELDPIVDNFIDCGPEVKSEPEDDVPLAALHNSYWTADDDHIEHSEDETKPHIIDEVKSLEIQPVYKDRKKDTAKKKKKDKSAKRNKLKNDGVKDQFTIKQMTEDEMRDSREQRKLAARYVDAKFRCESCIEGFKSQIDMAQHASEFHVETVGRAQCDICLSFAPASILSVHRSTHYARFDCRSCPAVAYTEAAMERHVATHSGKVGKNSAGTRRARNPGPSARRGRAPGAQRTALGYKCQECDKYFDDTILRWKHVQRAHREGHACDTCGKRFAFKHTLARHQVSHKGPPPREECAHCHKQVRVDLLEVHARIHAHRTRYSCAECNKSFVSKASYEYHLKYTQRHAQKPPNKHKCGVCGKAYRTRAELRDHDNYVHRGTTSHKCPVCEKLLATPRCVTRHVRRKHLGISEPRDKICQQCGKAFRNKKTLREHELIHSGERPLSCEACGRAFRQSAALHTHRRRVHRPAQGPLDYSELKV